jgi:NtrC-family two-component system sensor histidine kinase KinB
VRQAVREHEGLARGAGIELSVDVPPEPVVLQADAERIGVVLANLLGNAIRHTPPGGRVVARLEHTREGDRFEVKDSGEGIPAQYQERIFDRFFQVPGSKVGGVGLGLHISREVIRAHGGEMGVTSEVGKGSTFWFTLPVGPPPVA